MSAGDATMRQRVQSAWSGESDSPWWMGLLTPAEAAFRTAVAMRSFLYDKDMGRVTSSGVPTISVGNLTVGGTGKTPFAGWLIDELLRRNERPALLHGGYATDEPALHRAWHPSVPVLAQRDRVRAARQAAAGGATVLVLDDGFQHRRLKRDLDVVLVAAETWQESPRLLPRGPWREPPRALARADIVAVTRRTASLAQAASVAARVEPWSGGRPTAVVLLEARRWRHAGEETGPPPGTAFAVAAIAQPGAFAANAEAAGARIAGLRWYPDHHAYDVDDAGRLLQQAGGRPIMTTAKDAVKLAELIPPERLWVLEQEVRVEAGSEALQAALDRVLLA